MNLTFISGPRRSGKTTRLRQIEQDVAALGEAALFFGGAHSHQALRNTARYALNRGISTLLFDDCDEAQLQGLRDLALEFKGSPLVVYAVEAC